TAANDLRGGRRDLLARPPRGNRLRRTTGTTWMPLPACLAAAAPAVLRGLPRWRGNAPEQRLDRGADLLLNHVAGDRQQAPLRRHRSPLRLQTASSVAIRRWIQPRLR